MNLGKRLYDLQQLDLRLEKTADVLSRVEHQLNHNEALEKAKSDLQAIQQEQAALAAKIKCHLHRLHEEVPPGERLPWPGPPFQGADERVPDRVDGRDPAPGARPCGW